MTTGTLWERIKQGLVEGASSAAETAGYLGRLSKARLDIATTRHAIHGAFADLGGAVYDAVRAGDGEGLAGMDEVQSKVDAIRDLESELQAQETLLDTLRSSVDREDAPAAGDTDDSTAD